MTRATARPYVAIITPALLESNTGNGHTAARWATFLRGRAQVTVARQWDGRPADVMIALHARRSADSIARFADAAPGSALVVVLTGTDLYRDLCSGDAATRRLTERSLQLAHRVVVLNELGRQALPEPLRAKTTVILQSAAPLAPGRKPASRFQVAVIGHLRDEKNPQLVWQVAQQLDPRVQIRHAGAPLDPALEAPARRAEQQTPGYRWLGELSRARARQLVRRSHLLLHPSKMEGGAQAVIEAVMAGVPVIASRIDGNAGLLGRDYPGLFAPDDADAARALIERAAREPAFLARLARACSARAGRFDPARERAAVQALVDNRRRFAGGKAAAPASR
jgi:putative glycosyltransferase (TIGR04348 family)